jgi:hypothetical protein
MDRRIELLSASQGFQSARANAGRFAFICALFTFVEFGT